MHLKSSPSRKLPVSIGISLVAILIFGVAQSLENLEFDARDMRHCKADSHRMISPVVAQVGKIRKIEAAVPATQPEMIANNKSKRTITRPADTTVNYIRCSPRS